MNEDEFLDLAYRVVLQRPADEAALEAWGAIAAVSRSTVIRGLVESEEFERLSAIENGVNAAAEARAHGQALRDLSAPAGVDERAVEIPWVLSRYRGESQVLDVGSAFAHPVYLASLVGLGAAELVGVDLANADMPGMTMAKADVRELPFPAESF